MSDEGQQPQEQDTTFQDNLAILYMTFSVPSILGSVYIVQDVLKSKKRRSSVFHRIMVGMASIDMIYGLYTLFGPIALPGPDELDGFIINSYARGSWAAYNAISYFGQTARIASILYNGTLTMYYLLTLRFRWTESKAKQQAEKWFHILPVTVGLVVATIAISLGMFKDTPFGCTVAIQDSDDEQKKSYNLIVFLCLIWFVFIEIFVSMVMIYRSIRKTEQNANKWRMPSSSNLNTTSRSGSNKSLTRDLSKSSLKSFFEEANNAFCSKFHPESWWKVEPWIELDVWNFCWGSCRRQGEHWKSVHYVPEHRSGCVVDLQQEQRTTIEDRTVQDLCQSGVVVRYCVPSNVPTSVRTCRHLPVGPVVGDSSSLCPVGIHECILQYHARVLECMYLRPAKDIGETS